ncbi:fungal-specific transcription factor domain-containing protein [Aspergillus similis]
MTRSRSRRGCLTCRDKEVKCDETRPSCHRCIRLNRHCDYSERPRKKYTRRSQPSPVDQTHKRETPQQPITEQSSLADASVETNCLVVLSDYDKEAIHNVRYAMARRVDTKSPDYSGPALIWTLSQKSPMVLHMVCALGSLKLCHSSSASPRQVADIPRRKSEAAAHYGAGLRLLAAAIQNRNHQASELDFILATLWLMISYELAHGNGTGADLAIHLRGASLMLQGWVKTTLSSPSGTMLGGSKCYGITRLTSQLLLWIAAVDGCAVLNGFDASFNDLLGEAMFNFTADRVSARLETFRRLQQYATRVYYEAWTAAYPQSELIEDLQCSQIFALQAEAAQLRYLLGKLARSDETQSGSTVGAEALRRAIADVGLRYNDLITTASLLELPREAAQRRYVLNLRMVVPLYYAVALLFHSLCNAHNGALNEIQRVALQEIMTLAFRAYTDQGSEAVYRIAWPLFVAALESEDLLHRAWILERFDELAHQGENLRRAHQALCYAAQQRANQRRLGYLELLRDQEVEPFVLE